MAISVDEFLVRIARDLHEDDPTFSLVPPSAWSRNEMLAYLNGAELDFLRLTGIWQTDVSMAAVPGSGLLLDRPNNTMDINRMAFNGKKLYRQTSVDLEREDRDWKSNSSGKPSYWHEDNIPNSKFELNKVPAAGGTIRMFADYRPDPYSTIYESMHLRDTWEPYLRWKVLSFALAKDCEDQDLGRSKYAQQRYMVGVLLARRLIKGIAAAKLG